MLIGLVLGRVLGAPPYRGGTEMHPKTRVFVPSLLSWRQQNQAISHRTSYCGSNEIKPKTGGPISSLLLWRQRNQAQNEGFHIDPATVEAPRRKEGKIQFFIFL